MLRCSFEKASYGVYSSETLLNVGWIDPPTAPEGREILAMYAEMYSKITCSLERKP
jgi:hypothetical protein